MSKDLAAALFFCYFKFYQDPNVINQILEKYCKEFILQTSSGYNYREYKCYVLNIGGLDKAVNEIGGYIKTERETGFIDASPSDSISDQTIIMGLDRITGDDITLLNYLPEGTRMVFRNLTASDSGMAHKLIFKFSDKQKIIHPVCYTYDSSQVQIVEKNSVDIVDESDVDGGYDFSVDVNVTKLNGTMHTNYLSIITIVDEEKIFDSDHTSFGKFLKQNDSQSVGYVVYDFGQFTSLYIKGKNVYDATRTGKTYISYSNSPTGGWNVVVDTGYTDVEFSEFVNNISGRYIQVYIATGSQYNDGETQVNTLFAY